MAAANKYDRQLRLWGPHGQERLAKAHVALLRASATGTEALKNLVLPGIGQFTIIDAALVTAADLANNFFVESQGLGKPRSVIATALLTELNPDTRGNALVEDPVALAKKEPLSFAKYTLVIATQMDEAELLAVEQACVQSDVPLIVARTNGLLGHVRLWCKEHCVVESKPSPEPQEDLRIFNPWAELRAQADACHLDQLDDQEFGHTPFVIILIKALDAWRQAHAGKPPTGPKEKEHFVASIRAMSREGYGSEENLVEAVDKAYLCYGARPIPDSVADILRDDCAQHLVANSPNYWVLVKSLKTFVDKHGVLPLSGSLPDMKSTTTSYIALQRCYRAKAMEDLKEICQTMDAILAALGRSPLTIPLDDRALFCANAYHLYVDRFSRLAEEFGSQVSKSTVAEAVMEGLGDNSPMSPMVWYISWRAFDLVSNKQDSDAVLRKAKDLCSSTYDIDAELVTSSHAKEMVRFGGSEPHSIAALVGGIASQEAVKLVTGQYIPLNNTYLYNGIAGAGAAYRM